MTNPTTPAPAGGGMPKWLIILLVVLLVVVLGCCGGIATCFFLARKAVQAAPGFVQEQMKKNGVELNLPDASGTAQLPSNFPSDVPAYTGAKPIASSAQLKENAGEATWTSTDALADVKAFYEKQMVDDGWKEESNTSSGDAASLSYSKDDRIANIGIHSVGKGSNIVITYAKKQP